jgi:hypothetical protein
VPEGCRAILGSERPLLEGGSLEHRVRCQRVAVPNDASGVLAFFVLRTPREASKKALKFQNSLG